MVAPFCFPEQYAAFVFSEILPLQLVGGKDLFERFMRAYLNEFAFKTINSQQFRAFFLEHFKGKSEVDSINWDLWYYGRGKSHDQTTTSLPSICKCIPHNSLEPHHSIKIEEACALQKTAPKLLISTHLVDSCFLHACIACAVFHRTVNLSWPSACRHAARCGAV